MALVNINGYSFECRVAKTAHEHTVGLQKYSHLADDEGLLFEFHSPGYRTFHQADVSFPIDILFIHTGKVARIVEGLMPGDTGRYSAICDQVLELAGGTCNNLEIRRGDPVHVYADMHMQADAVNEWAPQVQQIRQRELQPDDNANGHVTPDKLVDIGALPEPSFDSFEQQPLQNMDTGLDVPHELQTRNSSKKAQIFNEGLFVDKVAPILATHAEALQWQPDALNGGSTERAVIGRSELAKLLSSSNEDDEESGDGDIGGASDDALQVILRASSTEQGLRLIGDAYVKAGLADFVRQGYKGKSNTLILYRSKDKDPNAEEGAGTDQSEVEDLPGDVH